MDILIIFTAALVGYLFLRSLGGEGFTIKAQLGDWSTKQGRRDRLMALSVSLIMLFTITFVMFRENVSSGTGYLLISPLFIGGLTTIISYIRRQR